MKANSDRITQKISADISELSNAQPRLDFIALENKKNKAC